MNRKMLVTRPKYDPITTHLHYWGRIILDRAKKSGITAYDLSERRCTRKEVSGHIKKLDPGFIVFHTHGDQETIFGNKSNGKEEILVRKGENESLLEGRITYSIACSSAKVLGRKCNPLAFVGYKEDFVFYYTPNKLFKPSTDLAATPCLESTTQIPLLIIKGRKVRDAVRASRARYIKNIKKQLRSKELEAPYVLQALIDNMSNLEVIGNRDSVF